MKRKSIIITFLILIFTMMLNLGYSAWLILKDKQIDPGYDPVGIYNYIEDNQSVVYNGNEQVPVISEELTTDISSFSYEYKIKDSDDSFIDGKPINVGTYTMNISSSIFGVAENITFTITKATPLINSVTPIYNQVSAKDATKYYDGYFTTAMVTSDIDFEYDIKGVKNEPLSGSLTYTDTRTKLEIGTVKYSYKFIPESANYNEVVVNFDEEKAVSIVTYATVNFINKSETVLTIEVEKDSIISNGPFDLKQTGYDLDGWYFNDTKWNFDTDKVVTDMTLIARWNPIEYTITYNLVGGQLPEGITNKETYTIEETFTINNPIKSGYTFAGWDIEYVGEKDHYHTELDFTYSEQTPNLIINAGTFGDLSLTAIWLAREYDITYVNLENAVFDLNGNPSSINPNPLKIKANQTITLINPTGKHGYNFDGWTLKDEDAPNLQMTLSNVRENLTITAHWTPIEYTITYYDKEKGKPLANTNGYETKYTIESNTITIVNPEKEGYTYNGWEVEFDTTRYSEHSTNDLSVNKEGSLTIPKGTYGDIIAIAQFEAIKYTITYKDSFEFDETQFSFNEEDNVIKEFTIEDLPVSVNTIVTKRGYTFEGWTTTNDDDSTKESVIVNPYQIESIGNITLYANWLIKEYNISYYDTEEGTTLACATGEGYPSKYVITDNVEIANPTKDRYVFSSWAYRYTNSETKETFVPSDGNTTLKWNAGDYAGDLIFVASFNVEQYQIEFELSGGSISLSNPHPYTVSSAEFVIPVPTKTGYIFDKWEIDGYNNVNADVEYVINDNKTVTIPTGTYGNMTFTAVWTPIEYTITYYDREKGKPLANTNGYETKYTIESNTITIVNPEKEGYTYNGWEVEFDTTRYSEHSTNDLSVNKEGSLTIPKGTYGDIIAIAQFEAIKYTITYKDSFEFDETQFSFNEEDNVIKEFTIEDLPVSVNTIVTKRGYTFEGWTTTNDDDSTKESVIVNPYQIESIGNITLYANWLIKEYNISYYDTEEGTTLACATGEGYPSKYVITDNVEIANPTKDRYVFSSWAYRYTNSETKETFVPSDGNTTLKWNAGDYAGDLIFVASFNVEQYQIEFELSGGSISLSNPHPYTVSSAEFVIPVPTKTGYIFDKWEIDGYNNVNADVEYVINDNKTVTIPTGTYGNMTFTAVWTPIEYTITYYDTDGKSQLPELTITEYNIESDDFTLPQPERAGYDFKGWVNVSITDGSFKDSYGNDPMNIEIHKGTYGYISVTASFSLSNAYRATYDLNDDNSASKAIIDLKDDEGNQLEYLEFYVTSEFIFPAPTRAGYKFEGWTVNNYKHVTDKLYIVNTDGSIRIIAGTCNDIEFVANWSDAIEYNISYYDTKYDSENPTDNLLSGDFTSTYTIEDDVEISNPTKNGYTFSSWTYTYSGSTDKQTFEPSNNTSTFKWNAGEFYGDLIFVATFGPETYKISYDYNIGDSVSKAIHDDSLKEYLVGSPDLKVSNPSRQGYTFTGWQIINQLINDTILFESINNSQYTISNNSYGDLKFVAQWSEAIPYYITLIDVYGEGYEFDEAGLNGTFNKDNHYVIEYNVDSENIIINVPKKLGNSFNGWVLSNETPYVNVDNKTIISENGICTIPKGTYGNLEFTAQWGEEEYTITYLDSGNFGNTKFDANEFELKDKFKVSELVEGKIIISIQETTKVIKNGYVLEGWTISDEDNHKEKSAIDISKFIIDSSNVNDITLYANWYPREYTITYYDSIYNAEAPEDNKLEVLPEVAPTTYKIVDESLSIGVPVKEGHHFKCYNYYNLETNEVKTYFADKETNLVNLDIGKYGNIALVALFSNEIIIQLSNNPIDDSVIYYDALPHSINSKLFINGEEIVEDNYDKENIIIKYTYSKKNSDDSYGEAVETIEVKDAGTYKVNVTITFTNPDNYFINETESVKEAFLTIKPLNIKVNTEEFGVSFNSAYRKWSEVLNQIATTSIEGEGINTVEFTKEDGTVLAGDLIPKLGKDYFVYSINDNNAIYNNNSLSTVMVGSTYQMLLSISGTENNYSTGTSTITDLNKNFNFVNGENDIVFKYKTVSINAGDKYYTIEEALSDTSGTITFAGNASSTSSYVETTFTLLSGYYSDTYNVSNRTILVPFEKSTEVKTIKNNNYTTNVYSALVIPSSITLNILGQGKIVAGAYITQGTPNLTVTNQRGVIVNKGTINVKDEGKIQAYGYIKGTGTINLHDSSRATDVMRVYDWPGGVKALQIKDEAFPMNKWTLHNISCDTYINNGAVYEAYAYVAVSMIITYDLERQVDIIGNTSSSNCMLKPASSGSDYIYKKSNIGGKNDITAGSQSFANSDDIYIYGSYADSTLYIEGALGNNFETSESISLPFGSMSLNIMSGSNITINNSDYLFYNGTSLFVDNNATLNIGSVVDVAAIDSSKVINNGVINCSGNIGGTIITNSPNSNTSINITNGKTIAYYTTLNGKKETNATGNIYQQSNGLFESRDYIPTLKNGTYYWIPKTININYDSGIGTHSKPIETVDNNINSGYTLSSTINIDEVPTAPNELYEFGGWYLDSSYSNSAAGVTIWKDVTLYAKWNKITYTIIYDIDNYMEGTEATGDVTYETIYNSFTIDTDKIVLSTPTHSEGYNFAGWYYDSNYSTKINNLALTNLAALAEYADSNRVVTLYGLWYSDPIEVTYVNSNSDYSSYLLNLDSKYKEIPADIGKVREFLLPDGMDDRNDDTGYNMYFDGWYIDDAYTKKITSFADSSVLTDEMINSYINSKKLTLYAKWEDKYEVSYYVTKSDKNIKETLKTSEWYYKETINVFGTGNQETILPNYYIDSWTINEVESDELAINIDKAYAIHYNALQVFTITVTTNQYCNIVITFTDGYYKNGSNDVMKKANSSEVTLSNGTSYVYATVNSTFTVDASEAIGGENPSHDYTGNGTLTESISITGTGESCLVEGTLITMADGTKKKVEDIVPGDMLLIFNHETGKYDVAPVLFNDSEERRNYNVINLVFSDGTIIKVVSEHGFFDLDLMKYVYINESTYLDYVGHRFFYSDIINGSISSDEVTLVNSYITNEYTKVYSPVTKYHLNYFTNNLLSMPGGIEGLFNIFEYDENLKYDEEKKQNDIETYGLYTYEDFKDLVSYEIYESFPANYFAVAIGKGLLTWDDIYYYIERYTPLM